MKSVLITVDETNETYELWIGQNKHDNHAIIKAGNPNDIWFHLESVSSPHFVLNSRGDKIPKRYLNYIASLFSQYKTGLSRYNVIYTQLKNVRLTNIIGTVTTSNTKIIRI